MNNLGIEAFLAVVHHGSLTDAANSLYLSQSTLSHRLAQLEREVGMTLIDRGRGLRTLSLTSDGQEFLTIAKRWSDLVHETTQIRTRKQNMTLSIGSVDSIQNYVLPPVFELLTTHSEKIDIRIRTQQSSELYLLLERGEIDIAFSHLEQPMPNMIIKKFYSEKMVVISKGKLISNGKKLNDKQLDTSYQLYFDWNTSFKAWYDGWIGDRKYPTVHLDTAQLLLTFMDNDKKWAIIPLSMAKKLESTGDFFIYHLEDPPPERVCYQIRSRNPRASAVESLKLLDNCINSVII